VSLVALVGIVVFLLGLLLSIALHEVGHLVPAKIFGVRVTQWMVGFGPTMWSRRVGETEYGLKWIPLGGYNRMIGMLPPQPGDDPAVLRRTSTGPFQAMVESARDASMEEIGPGDEDRVFYRKRWWQKVVIMLGGPVMNLVLAVALLGVVLVGFGVQTPQPVVAAVSDCVVPASEQRACTAKDPLTPAAGAGLKPGDKVLSFNGKPVAGWKELTELIRPAPAGPATMEIERNGQRLTLQPNLVVTDRPAPTAAESKRTEKAGFLGIEPVVAPVRQGPDVVVARMWEMTSYTAGTLLRIPEKMVGVWNAAFGGQERSLDSPVGIVGASRIGGEIASQPVPLRDRVAGFLLLLASFNVAIGVFNLVPLLPLDGGHIAGALWEGIRNGIARVLRRPAPGYVDVAKALPVAYTVAVVLVAMSVLLIYADLVNPVRAFD
jgi:membrane-associated protease RseP (regulator of RpoE activity)